MNAMEGRTRIEGLIEKRDDLLNDAASIVSKVIVDRSRKQGDVEQNDIDNLLRDFTSDEKYLIMIKVVSILARNSDLRDSSSDKSDSGKKRSNTNSIFASRGYK